MNPFEQFATETQKALQIANREAHAAGAAAIGAAHVLVGLACLPPGPFKAVADKLGLDPKRVRYALEKYVAASGADVATMGPLPFTPRVRKILQLAIAEAREARCRMVMPEHLLLALLREGSSVATKALADMGIDYDRAAEAVRQADEEAEEDDDGGDDDGEGPSGPPPGAPSGPLGFLGTLGPLGPVKGSGEGEGAETPDGAGAEPAPGEKPAPGGEAPGSPPASPSPAPAEGAKAKPRRPRRDTPALDTFGRDLVKAAREGKLDPMIGRTRELERLIQILCRRGKNNAALIGEAGVGKTAVVEGLAKAIADGDVPEPMLRKRIVSLDLTLMVAGTKFRGQFEERIKHVIDETRRSEGEIILFIDEIHTLVGAGDAEGAMDAANILKPALARGEVQCIGATTLDEYRKSIEKDPALERRFQTLRIEEPTVEETVEILRGLAPRYEAHHKVRYTDDALEEAARLSARYVSGRQLPDKAIDLIDESGARARIVSSTRPAAFQEEERAIRDLEKTKEEAVATQDFEKAARLRDELVERRKSLDERVAEWNKAREESGSSVVDGDAIALTLSRSTGIPVARMGRDEAARMLGLESELEKAVVGQKEAISAVSRALRRSRTGLRDSRRPIGSFLFLGPTGVGKTLLARTIAEQVFGSEKALIQVDMSEYAERHEVSRLVGAPPGYVGYDQGGQLTERVRRRPYSVVLFDEVEKAHPDVMQTFLQILDEGRLTDGQGRKIDFRNTIVVLTSNLGVDATRGSRHFGFGESGEAAAQEQMRAHVMDAAKRTFRPELLNRFDATLVFRQLSREDIVEILRKELSGVVARLAERGIALELDDSATSRLAETGMDPAYGARPLRRAVESLLEDPLADALLRGSVTAPCRLRATAAPGAPLAFEPL